MAASTPAVEVVIATLMRETGGSGVQSHVGTLRSFAQQSGHPVTLVTPFSDHSPLLRPVFGARLAVRLVSNAAGVRWYRYWHGHYLGRALAAYLESATGPLVVYAQDPVSAAVALRVRRSRQVAVVMAVHFNVSQALEWADKGEVARDSRTFAEIRALEDQVLPRLDGVVYVSKFMRDLLVQRLPDLGAVPGVVIPNSVEVIRRPATAPQADLVTVGALEPRKNQGYLLDVLAGAAVRGHRYTLTIVGDGPDRGQLERQAERLGLGGQVRFAGYLDDPRPTVAAHRLYCHASRMESFGIALIEAMAEGLPVLAAPVGGIPEIVRPGIDGDLWSLDDPQDGADRLIAILSDPARRDAMAAAAQSRAEEEFSSARQAPRLLDFLARATRRA